MWPPGSAELRGVVQSSWSKLCVSRTRSPTIMTCSARISVFRLCRNFSICGRLISSALRPLPELSKSPGSTGFTGRDARHVEQVVDEPDKLGDLAFQSLAVAGKWFHRSLPPVEEFPARYGSAADSAARSQCREEFVLAAVGIAKRFVRARANSSVRSWTFRSSSAAYWYCTARTESTGRAVQASGRPFRGSRRPRRRAASMSVRDCPCPVNKITGPRRPRDPVSRSRSIPVFAPRR